LGLDFPIEDEDALLQYPYSVWIVGKPSKLFSQPFLSAQIAAGVLEEFIMRAHNHKHVLNSWIPKSNNDKATYSSVGPIETANWITLALVHFLKHANNDYDISSRLKFLCEDHIPCQCSNFTVESLLNAIAFKFGLSYKQIQDLKKRPRILSSAKFPYDVKDLCDNILSRNVSKAYLEWDGYNIDYLNFKDVFNDSNSLDPEGRPELESDLGRPTPYQGFKTPAELPFLFQSLFAEGDNPDFRISLETYKDILTLLDFQAVSFTKVKYDFQYAQMISEMLNQEVDPEKEVIRADAEYNRSMKLPWFYCVTNKGFVIPRRAFLSKLQFYHGVEDTARCPDLFAGRSDLYSIINDEKYNNYSAYGFFLNTIAYSIRAIGQFSMREISRYLVKSVNHLLENAGEVIASQPYNIVDVRSGKFSQIHYINTEHGPIEVAYSVMPEGFSTINMDILLKDDDEEVSTNLVVGNATLSNFKNVSTFQLSLYLNTVKILHTILRIFANYMQDKDPNIVEDDVDDMVRLATFEIEDKEKFCLLAQADLSSNKIDFKYDIVHRRVSSTNESLQPIIPLINSLIGIRAPLKISDDEYIEKALTLAENGMPRPLESIDEFDDIVE
jgi:hypothetical protein